MASRCSSKRHNDPAERIYKRLGLWPEDIFKSRGRSKLCPPKWSVGLLASLSGLIDYFNKFDRAQAHPGSAPPNATTRQQRLHDRIAPALIEEIDKRIKQQTKMRGKGSALVAHPPKRTHLTPQDVQTVRDKHEASREGSSYVPEGYDAEEDDGWRVIVGEDEGQDDREEGAEYDSKDQHAEEEEDYNSNDEDREDSEDESNLRQSLDLPENKVNGQRDEVDSLPASPSSPAALVGTAPPKTSTHDQNVASGNLAGKASLSAPVNTGSSSAARNNLNLKAGTHAIGNDGSINVNGISLRSTRQAQPSSPQALPTAPTSSPMPRQLTSLASLYRHESSGHVHPTTCSQSSFVTNKRPRLSGHCSNNSQSTDQASSSDTETNLTNDDNGHSNTQIVNTSKRNFVQENLRLEGGSRLILEYGELSAEEAIRQQSVKFTVSAAELKETISRQSALNAADKETVVKMGELSEKISEMIGQSSQKLAATRSKIKLHIPAFKSLQHSLDYVTKADTTGRDANDLKGFIDGFMCRARKYMELEKHLKLRLESLQDDWRYSEQERATALDRQDQGVKAALTAVIQHDDALKIKKYWDLVALAIRMGPDRLEQVMGSHAVVAEYGREPLLVLAQNEQEVAL